MGKASPQVPDRQFRFRAAPMCHSVLPSRSSGSPAGPHGLGVSQSSPSNFALGHASYTSEHPILFLAQCSSGKAGTSRPTSPRCSLDSNIIASGIVIGPRYNKLQITRQEVVASPVCPSPVGLAALKNVFSDRLQCESKKSHFT